MAEQDFGAELLTEVKGIQGKTLKLAEEFGVQSAQVKRYQENADAKWKEFDEKNEKLVQALKEKETLAAEHKERIEHLEKLMSAKGTAAETKETLTQYANDSLVAWMKSAKVKNSWRKFSAENPKAAESYFKNATKQVDTLNELPNEAKELKDLVMQYKTTPDILRTDIGEFGNFLCPTEWSNELRRQIIEVSPIRKYARVKQIGAKTLEQPIRQGVPTALWEGETQSATASQSNYTNMQISPYRLANITQITWDMLNDSQYNIADEIITDNAIAFAKAEGLASVKGAGAHQSLGFAADSNVPIYKGTTSATLTWQDMVNITGQLKTGYDPMYFFNRFTLAYLRTLVDSNQRPLWLGPFGNIESGPATINGYKYSAEFIDMDNYSVANGNAVLFADMRSFYQITDRSDLLMIRDEYTGAAQALVKFTLMKWTFGIAVMKEAGVLYQRLN